LRPETSSPLAHSYLPISGHDRDHSNLFRLLAILGTQLTPSRLTQGINMSMLKAAIRPAYQQFERLYESSPSRILPSEDTVDFLEDPVAASVAARQLVEIPAPTPTISRTGQPSKCEIEGNSVFECVDARTWFTAQSRGKNCEEMFVLMKQFLSLNKHPQMSQYYLNRQRNDDSGEITLNTFCVPCKTFYTQKVNSWFSCYVNKCNESYLRYSIYHADTISTAGKLVLRSIKGKCKHRDILETGLEMAVPVEASTEEGTAVTTS
jgi:hypothetical protein